MDDLTELRDAWNRPDPPSGTAHSAARATLLRRIAADGTPPEPARGTPRRPGPRLAWLVGGTALTAALAAAAVFGVVPDPAQPEQPIAQSPSQLSGRQILLAAASVAEAKPMGSGRYWHVTQSFTAASSAGGTYTQQTWTAQDGTLYIVAPDAGGLIIKDPTGVVMMPKRGGFEVARFLLSHGRLKQLPADPAALKAWITNELTTPADRRGSRIPAADLPRAVASELSALLWLVPASPAVRAASFRALASMPNVTNLGEAQGGQALRLSFPPPSADTFTNRTRLTGADEITLIVDPATATLLSSTTDQGTLKILVAEWTNDLPKVMKPAGK